MSNCLIKNSEYWTKLEQSGIPEFQFYSFANSFVSKHGRFPNLDEIPRSNSSQYLKDTIHVNTNNSAKIEDILMTTQTEDIQSANIVLNDQHTDLEVELTPLNKEAIVEIRQRPSEYTRLDSIDLNIDDSPNTGVLFNNLFTKLHTLYGIDIIPITDKELASDKWSNIPSVKNVSAFIYNGNTYINTDIASIDAPIHEMTHLLLGSIRFKNQELYQELVSMADRFPNFQQLVLENPNKTQLDVYEEVFVQEMSRYLSGLPSELDYLDDKIKYELHYNIKRLLDSALMGQYSVKSISDESLYNMSLKDLIKSVNSTILKPTNIGTLEDAHLHRILANQKSDLMKKGDLREECS